MQYWLPFFGRCQRVDDVREADIATEDFALYTNGCKSRAGGLAVLTGAKN